MHIECDGYTEDLSLQEEPHNKFTEENHPFADHSCADCGKKFMYEKSLTLHIKNTHISNSLDSSSKVDPGVKLSCPICHGCLSTEFQMNQHIRLCHPDSEGDVEVSKLKQNYLMQSEFVCEYCNADFVSKEKLEIHVKTNHEDPPRKSVNEHPSRKSSVSNKLQSRMCHPCNRTFSCRSSLLSHNSNYHSPKKIQNNDTSFTYACKLCGRGFDRKLSLVTHLRFHPEMKGKNNLTTINKRTARNRKYVPPSNNYTERDSLYFCNFCLKSEPSVNAIQKHIKQFHIAGTSISSINTNTSASDPSKQSKIKDMTLIASDPNKTINIDRPIDIPEGSDVNVTSASLKNYTKIGSKKLQCNICSKIFHSVNGMDYHLHKHILGENYNVTRQHYTKEDSNYVCNICNKILNTSSGIQYHIRHTHLKVADP